MKNLKIGSYFFGLGLTLFVEFCLLQFVLVFFPNFSLRIMPLSLFLGIVSLLIISISYVVSANLEDKEKKRILFFDYGHYYFSNFSAFKIIWNGFEWMTSEHLYQAYKFDDHEIIEEIRLAPSAREAKKIAKKHKESIRTNWYEVRLCVMEAIVRAKMDQHPFIKDRLLKTGDLEIIEDSPYDDFWGRGKNWDGQNHLGKIWMKLRDELKKGGFNEKC